LSTKGNEGNKDRRTFALNLRSLRFLLFKNIYVSFGLRKRMKVRVQYTAQMRAVAGAADEQIELPPDSNLGTLLGHLAHRWGPDGAAHLLAPNSQPLRSLLIVVNDAAIAGTELAQKRLADNDVITLYPPIAGG
jgi:molybdopterin converting factor small subunit